MGGTNDPDNLVELTVEDHAIAHFVLWKMFGRREDKIAWLGLSSTDAQEFHAKKMKEANPMSDPDIKAKHLRAVRSKSRAEKLSKAKMGNTNTKGKSWFNDGVKTGMFFECPEGWTKGRLNPHWNHKRKKNED